MKPTYTHAHLWFSRSILTVNHHNNKNWVPSITHNLWLIFIGKKQKKLFLKNKNSKWPTQKKWVFQNRQFSIFFVEISCIGLIGPWVTRIDWCEGHWWGSTYMAVRLSDISSKTGKKFIFFVFRPFYMSDIVTAI